MKLRTLLLLLLGFVAAASFTSHSTGGERRSSDYDQAQHAPLAAYAVEVMQQPAMLLIQRGKFHCEAGEHRALLVGRGPAWVGCARIEKGRVELRFEDGDTTTINTGPDA